MTIEYYFTIESRRYDEEGTRTRVFHHVGELPDVTLQIILEGLHKAHERTIRYVRVEGDGLEKSYATNFYGEWLTLGDDELEEQELADGKISGANPKVEVTEEGSVKRTAKGTRKAKRV